MYKRVRAGEYRSDAGVTISRYPNGQWVVKAPFVEWMMFSTLKEAKKHKPVYFAPPRVYHP